jgi:hypothetical protein
VELRTRVSSIHDDALDFRFQLLETLKVLSVFRPKLLQLGSRETSDRLPGRPEHLVKLNWKRGVARTSRTSCPTPFSVDREIRFPYAANESRSLGVHPPEQTSPTVT